MLKIKSKNYKIMEMILWVYLLEDVVQRVCMIGLHWYYIRKRNETTDNIINVIYPWSRISNRYSKGSHLTPLSNTPNVFYFTRVWISLILKNEKIVYLQTCANHYNMVSIEDLRICMECGTVFAKKPSSSKLVLKCPNCKSIRRGFVDIQKK